MTTTTLSVLEAGTPDDLAQAMLDVECKSDPIRKIGVKLANGEYKNGVIIPPDAQRKPDGTERKIQSIRQALNRQTMKKGFHSTAGWSDRGLLAFLLPNGDGLSA